MGSTKPALSLVFGGSNNGHRPKPKAPEAAQLNPKVLKNYLILNDSVLEIIQNPFCVTWLVTWNDDSLKEVVLNAGGRYFTLNVGEIHFSDCVDITFGEKVLTFSGSANIYDETWKVSREVGIIVLDTEQCRKLAKNRVLVCLPIPTLLNALRYLLEGFIRRIAT